MWTRDDFGSLCRPPVIGMVHLRPLPGSPGWAGDLSAVEEAALTDTENLLAGGVGAVMVENFHDVPFFPGPVPPVTVAAMTRIIGAVTGSYRDLPVGVNVLRNDAESALAVAVATGASFIRVNVHVGAAVTDQGTIEGRAWQTLRLRRQWAPAVGILADVRVKHARPLAPRPLAEEARDLRLRGLADGIIVTGAATGSGTSPADVEAVRAAVSGCPLLVGSGVDTDNIAGFAPAADGVIVGTSLKEKTGERFAAVSSDLTRDLVAAWKRAENNLEETS